MKNNAFFLISCITCSAYAMKTNSEDAGTPIKKEFYEHKQAMLVLIKKRNPTELSELLSKHGITHVDLEVTEAAFSELGKFIASSKPEDPVMTSPAGEVLSMIYQCAPKEFKSGTFIPAESILPSKKR